MFITVRQGKVCNGHLNGMKKHESAGPDLPVPSILFEKSYNFTSLLQLLNFIKVRLPMKRAVEKRKMDFKSKADCQHSPKQELNLSF